MANYGRAVNDTGGSGQITNQGRIALMNPMTENGWGYLMGARINRWYLSAGTANTRYAIYKSNGDYWGRTNEFAVTAAGSFAGDCALYTQNITDSNQALGNPNDSAVMLFNGQSYYLGYFVIGATLIHQQINAADADYDNENFYDHTGLGSTIPPNPYGSTFVHNEGMLNVYIQYDPNVAPDKPTAGIAPSGTITSLTPTFTATFTDGNTSRGDYLSNIDIELRIQGTSTYKWNTSFAPSGSETGGLNRAYGGTALTAGVTYEWRVRFADAFGAWGAWSDWTVFTVNAGGTVGTPTAPTGKLLTVQPPTFSAPWTHGSALSTKSAQVRIRKGGTVVRGPFTKVGTYTVASGGTISFTWAETGFADLDWSTGYIVEIKGQDTGNVWSDWSSPYGTFTTDYRPTVPTNLTPASGSAVSSLPLLSFTMSDPDNTPGGGGLTAEIRIKTNAGALLFTRNPAYNATTGKWEYQTTATDFASFATYKWDARGRDGTLDSDYSVEQTVVYGNGPVIGTVQINGVAAGGATPPTNTPVITWVVTGSTQSSYRIRIYASPYTLGNTALYDSGTVVSGVSSHTVPSGYLHNLTSYVLIITVTNTVPLTGDSSPYTFTVTFTPLTAIQGFQASPIAVAGDKAGATSAILLGWTIPTTLPEDSPTNFIETVLTRKVLGQADTEIILARLTAIEQNTYVDYFPASGVVYEYGAYKIAYQGTDISEAPGSFANTSVNFQHAIVSSALNPTARRAALLINKATSVDHKGEMTPLFPWGAGEPTIIVSPVHYHVVTGQYQVITTASQSAESVIEALDDMHEAFEVVCYRDERGVVVFGHCAFKVDYEILRRYVISLIVTESNFKQGVL